MTYTFRDKYNVAPADLKPGDCFAVKVVAVVGYANDWAAYEAPTGDTDLEVVKRGTKLSEEQAAPLFWVLRTSGREYRK